MSFRHHLIGRVNVGSTPLADNLTDHGRRTTQHQNVIKICTVHWLSRLPSSLENLRKQTNNQSKSKQKEIEEQKIKPNNGKRKTNVEKPPQKQLKK